MLRIATVMRTSSGYHSHRSGEQVQCRFAVSFPFFFFFFSSLECSRRYSTLLPGRDLRAHAPVQEGLIPSQRQARGVSGDLGYISASRERNKK